MESVTTVGECYNSIKQIGCFPQARKANHHLSREADGLKIAINLFFFRIAIDLLFFRSAINILPTGFSMHTGLLIVSQNCLNASSI